MISPTAKDINPSPRFCIACAIPEKDIKIESMKSDIKLKTLWIGMQLIVKSELKTYQKLYPVDEEELLMQ